MLSEVVPDQSMVETCSNLHVRYSRTRSSAGTAASRPSVVALVRSCAFAPQPPEFGCDSDTLIGGQHRDLVEPRALRNLSERSLIEPRGPERGVGRVKHRGGLVIVCIVKQTDGKS